MSKEEKFTITCSKEQLQLIANAVEDWSRFLSGQCEMHNATLMLENHRELYEELNKNVHPLVTPLLPRDASYGWNGGNCPNEHQKKAIAMSYGIYRQILHFFAMQRSGDDWNVYKAETLTCPEQGGLIKIEPKVRVRSLPNNKTKK